MDKLFLHDLEFETIIGTKKEEQLKLQKILVDLELFTDFSGISQFDDLTKTINYSSVFVFVKELIAQHSFQLIESLAEDLAEKLLEKFSLSKVVVRIKKPSAAQKYSGREVGVEIERHG